MAKIYCPTCKTSVWKSIVFKRGKATLVCNTCSRVVIHSGGVEVDTVVGESRFEF